MKIVIAIDGGGIRGLIPAHVLAELEIRAGRPLHEVVDMIVGTSTGGLLACAVSQGVPASEFPDIYRKRANDVFDRPLSWKMKTGFGLWGPKYPDTGLRRVLEGVLPAAPFSSSLVHAAVLIYELRMAKARVLTSWSLDAGRYGVRDAALGTSAAATYIAAPQILFFKGEPGERREEWTDGGLGAPNPTVVALSLGRRLWGLDEPLVILSLGTGYHAVHYSRTRWWGLYKFAGVVHEMMLDASSDYVPLAVPWLLGDDDEYTRVQVELDREIPMDATGEEELAYLDRVGRWMASSVRVALFAQEYLEEER